MLKSVFDVFPEDEENANMKSLTAKESCQGGDQPRWSVTLYNGVQQFAVAIR